MRSEIAHRERSIVSPITCVKRLTFAVYTFVYSVYRVQRNAVSFQQRFPGSSFAEFAKLFGVFVGKSLFVSQGFESVDTAAVGDSFSHKTISTKKYGILCRTNPAFLHKNCRGVGEIHLHK